MRDVQLELSFIPQKNLKVGNIQYRIKEKDGITEIHSLHAIYFLKEVERDIWNKIDGKKSIKEICNLIFEEYSGNKDIIFNDVLKFIKKLRDKNLVTIKSK